MKTRENEIWENLPSQFLKKVSINIFFLTKVQWTPSPRPQPAFFKNVTVYIAHLEYKILGIENRLCLLAGELVSDSEVGVLVCHWWTGRFFIHSYLLQWTISPWSSFQVYQGTVHRTEGGWPYELAWIHRARKKWDWSWRRYACSLMSCLVFSGCKVTIYVLCVKNLVVVFSVKDLAFKTTLYLWLFNKFWACIVCKEK